MNPPLCRTHGVPRSACDCIDPVSKAPVLDGDAWHGPAGHIAATLAEHSEASPTSLLGTVLVRSATAVGAGAWLPVNAAGRLTTRLYGVIVGDTARARKGSAERDVRAAWSLAQPDDGPITGLSTGEGLIAALANRPEPEALVVAEEFARVLTVMGRDGNTLSSVLRELYDSGSARVLTRAEPLQADGVHLGLLAHITAEELHLKLRGVDAANGFANRFVWLYVSRGKVLPNGGRVTPETLLELSTTWARAVSAGRAVTGPLRRSADAGKMWNEFYEQHAERPELGGMYGALTSRAEAHTAKLSLLYALLDGSDVIAADHHRAATAVWRCADESLRRLFPPSATGDPVADRIHEQARRNGGWLPWSQIYAGHHSLRAEDVDAAVELLTARGLATVEETARSDGRTGRPRRILRLRGES